MAQCWWFAWYAAHVARCLLHGHSTTRPSWSRKSCRCFFITSYIEIGLSIQSCLHLAEDLLEYLNLVLSAIEFYYGKLFSYHDLATHLYFFSISRLNMSRIPSRKTLFYTAHVISTDYFLMGTIIMCFQSVCRNALIKIVSTPTVLHN